jgi:hypothetical protein
MSSIEYLTAARRSRPTPAPTAVCWSGSAPIVQQLDWPLPKLLEMTRVFASSRAVVTHSMIGFLRRVRTDFGTVERALGLTEQVVARLQARYLD